MCKGFCAVSLFLSEFNQKLVRGRVVRLPRAAESKGLQIEYFKGRSLIFCPKQILKLPTEMEEN
jgi:hypothetical protein